MQTARVAPLWAASPLHNTVSHSYVNNWSSAVVSLKFVAFRGKQTHFSCLYTTLSQVFSSPLFSSSLFPEHAPIIEPLNRSVSFFPCEKKRKKEKALFSSYLFVCCCCFVFFLFLPWKSLLFLRKEEEERVTNGPGDWPHLSCAALALQPTVPAHTLPAVAI